MKYLNEKKLPEVIRSITNPFLGICLGLQLMCKNTEEGNTACLGIFDTKVKLFPPLEIVPHMGWNNFENISGTLFKDVNTMDDVYYIHSYYAEQCEATVSTCDYMLSFSAALQKDNFYATQFHPEKSAGVGEQILKNFLEL
jgi:glutamine amidotransferase